MRQVLVFVAFGFVGLCIVGIRPVASQEEEFKITAGKAHQQHAHNHHSKRVDSASDFDILTDQEDETAEENTPNQENPTIHHPHQHPTMHRARHNGREDEVDIEPNSQADQESPLNEQDQESKNDGGIDQEPDNAMKKKRGRNPKGKRAKNRKMLKEQQAEQERGWHYCSDGRPPKDVKDLDIDEQGMGHMCRELYPTSTCCYDHDLTTELVGDKILEQIPEMQCARMLMKLRCAHCSPRSWWLFHAPDKKRYPHKRVLPIMCPGFCRKFHRLCRDSVAGLEIDNFCDFHTTDQEGPCYPDSFVKRGTID